MIRFLFVLLFVFSLDLCAQKPSNDDCQNAETIVIGNSGFDLGTYTSNRYDVSNAGIQSGEVCSPDLSNNNNCSKTLWFRFYLPVNRDVSIQLKQQDSAIPQIFGGFNVYKVKSCSYTLSDLSAQLTALGKFGLSGNTCLSPGWYYVQAGFNQRARGQVWLELIAQKGQSQSYDNHTQPYDFGLVKNADKNTTLYPDCATMEKSEWQAINNDSFSRSLFARFVVPANTSLHNVFVFNNNPGRLRYRFFTDTMTLDSINSAKPFTEISPNTTAQVMRLICSNAAQRKYFIQIISGYEDVKQVRISMSNSAFNTDLWSTPSTNDVINTYNGYSRMVTHEFNCNGNLAFHGCKGVIPKQIEYKWRNGWYDQVDTFVYAGYTVINSSQSGVLRSWSKSNLTWTSCVGMYYLLYKGDITKNCNLVEVFNGYDDTMECCITNGTYTLVTVCRKEFTGAFYHFVWQESPVLNQVNYYPRWPEFIGTISPTSGTLFSRTIHINDAKDTTLTVDTFSIKGYMIYREFRVGSKMSVDLYDNVTNQTKVLSYYIFKGQFSKGNVSLIKGRSYVPQHYFFGFNGCDLLDTGMYSLLCVYDSRNRPLPCATPPSYVVLNPSPVCTQDTFYYPKSAYKVFGHKDVLSGNTINLDYVYTLPHCLMCNTPTAIPELTAEKKFQMYDQQGFSYYTFYLGSNAEFRTNHDEYSFELFKGDCTKDPGLILDSMNIVSRCNGFVYCNLEGGKYYTFVAWGVPYSNFIKLYFTPHVKSPNDFARSAYDLGHFSQNKTTTAPPLPITCHTSGYDSDPCAYENGKEFCSYKYWGNITIPFIDTLNLKRNFKRRNIWYTFTVDGSADVTVSLFGQTTFNRTRLFSVYRYAGPYQQNVANALGQGFDSTGSQMQWLVSNRRIQVSGQDSRENTARFSNTSCNSNRYFVLVENECFDMDKANYNYVVTVDVQPSQLPKQGDFCSTAVAGTITGLGKTVVKADNICHTYGQSPNELDTAIWIKSSWFKISVSGLKKFDLKIKKTAGVGVLYYNVYGGSCGNLVKIIRPDDGRSYFVLSCMGGTFDDYYIQAVSSTLVNEEISFEIETLVVSNAGCKPFDFTPPEAIAEVKGLCGSDSLRFFSKGYNKSDKVMFWYLNHSLFSKKKNPVLATLDPLVKDSNFLQLVVTDTVSLLSDTFEMTVKPNRKAYSFKILGPDSVRCKEAFTLKPDTDFKGTLSYLWTGVQDPGPYSVTELKVTGLTGKRKYFLKGSSGECVFYDTIEIAFNPFVNLFRDTGICPDGTKITYHRQNLQSFTLNGTPVNSDSFSILTPGDYQLKYKYNGCDAEEILKVKQDTTSVYQQLRDTVEACNAQKVTLKKPFSDLKSIAWSTGETSDQIIVNKAGEYVLRGSRPGCVKTDYRVLLKMETYQKAFLKDTILCVGQTYILDNPMPQFSVVYAKPPLGPNRLNANTYRILHLKKGLCLLNDTSLIQAYQTDGFQKDTMVCDSGAAISIDLDAGPAIRYSWAPVSHSSRIYTARSFGKYYVYRTQDHSCMDTGVFNVRMNCPINVYVPNVFTPDANRLNDFFQPLVTGNDQPYAMQIYNRWGELLFETVEGGGWSGIYSGQPVPDGVYVYVLRVRDLLGKEYHFRGTFTVLR